MLYFLFSLLLLTIAGMASGRAFKNNQRKKLTHLRDQWGQIKQGNFNFEHIGIYTQHHTEATFHQLSEQTKNDIDFNDIFYVIDRTTSHVGQQFLYDVLSKPTNDTDALKQLSKQADFFTDNISTRESVQQLLSNLNNKDAYFIATQLKEDLPVKPLWYKFVAIYMLVVLGVVAVSPLYPRVLIWLLIPLAINVFLHYRNKIHTKRFNRSFPQLNILINTCKKLLLKDLPFDATAIKSSMKDLQSMQRKSNFLSLDGPTFKDELTQLFLFLFEFIKAFFLVEFFIFYSLLKEVAIKRTAIKSLFQYVGNIDMALSIAALRDSNFATCVPVFLPVSKQLSCTGLYHPLIKDCIGNSIEVQSKSILITGSNMSGKTTFLRTVALNAIVAQTICTCFATEYNAPILKLHSSIRIDDSLLDAKSYYFEEVTVMAKLIEEAKQEWQNIFVLDEVFKGTNTVERIAAAKAILSFLNKKNNLVFVSTHDVELSAMLASEYDLYHFAELIENDQFTFDHILKTGPLITSNAIRILALYNYPEEIIEEAKCISSALSITAITAL